MRSTSLLVAFLLLGVFLVASGAAAETTKPTGKAEAEVDKALADADGTHGIYLEAGLSALIFQPPERESFSLYMFGNHNLENVQTGVKFSSDEITLLPRMALGYRFDSASTPSCLGDALRIELSSSYMISDAEDSVVLPVPPEYLGAGLVGGIFYDSSGSPYLTLLSASVGGILQAPLPVAKFNAEYEQLDLNLGVRTDYGLVKDRLSISPYVGFTFQTFDQEFKLATQSQGPLIGPIGRYRARETFDTEALGATVGLDFNVQITGHFSFTIGGTVSPLWADTHMDLLFSGDPLLGPVGVSTKYSEDKEVFTFRAGAKACFSYEVTNWLVISACGGMDYWDYVPTVGYPTYAASESANALSLSYVAHTPSLDSDNMLNWKGGINFTFRFGGP